MRIITTAALVATLSLAAPAFAQAPAAGSPAENAPARSDAPAKTSVQISKIQVVDVKQLPATMKSQVDDLVSKTSAEDMNGLRASIDASPAAAGALKEKGLTSAQVVAINIADGVLTMFARVA
jgi:hypothetical protein